MAADETLHSPPKQSTNWHVSMTCTWDKNSSLTPQAIKQLTGQREMHMRQDQGDAKEGGRTETKKPKRRKVKLHTSSHSSNARKMAKHDLQPNKPDRKERKEERRKKYHHSPQPRQHKKAAHTHTLSLSIYGSFLGRFLWFHAPVSAHGCSRHGKSCQWLPPRKRSWWRFHLSWRLQAWMKFVFLARFFILPWQRICNNIGYAKVMLHYFCAWKVAEFSGNYRQLFGLRLRRGEEHQMTTCCLLSSKGAPETIPKRFPESHCYEACQTCPELLSITCPRLRFQDPFIAPRDCNCKMLSDTTINGQESTHTKRWSILSYLHSATWTL